MLALAKNPNLKVLAEGVETIEQLEFLRAEGCDELQGYLISQPIPANDFVALLASTEPLINLTPLNRI